jgi:hypothetical protein
MQVTISPLENGRLLTTVTLNFVTCEIASFRENRVRYAVNFARRADS